MKLSLTTWCYRDLPAEEAIRRIGDWGVEGIELIAHAPSFHVRVDFSDEEVARTKELLAEYGLAISAISPHTEFLQFDESGRQAEIAHTQATVDLCLRLGADHARLFPGGAIPADRSRQEMVDAVVACLRPCVAYAAERGVRLSLENHGQFGRDTELLEQILATVDSPWLGVTLHTGRSDSAGRDMAQVARIFGERIFHLHLNDGVETPSGLERRAVGEGSLDFPAIFQVLEKTGYDGYYNIEYGHTPDVEKLISKSLTYLRKTLGQ